MTDPAELAKRLRKKKIPGDLDPEIGFGRVMVPDPDCQEAAALLDQLASTMSAEEVREAAAKIAEASGNTPRTIASLIRAMPLTG